MYWLFLIQSYCVWSQVFRSLFQFTIHYRPTQLIRNLIPTLHLYNVLPDGCEMDLIPFVWFFFWFFFFEEDSYDLYTDQKRKPRPIPLKILLKNTICSTPVTKYRVHPIKRCLGHFYKKIYGYATINNSTWYKKTRYGKGKRPKS
jgi:hypothetical protein